MASKLRMLDLFSGRWGWSKAFAARGWECTGVDLTAPPETPPGCTFLQLNVLDLDAEYLRGFDFICASSPCEQFSVHGLKCFFKDPPYPALGVELFNHTRDICEASGRPYVMENVRAAQKFVGNAAHRCGPFCLWGNGVPPLMPQGITKPFRGASGSYMALCPPGHDRKLWRNAWQSDFERKAGSRKACASIAATIPPELAATVCDYAERLVCAEVSR